MLKAHRKDVTSLIKGKKASGNLKDKEREIREKLVLKLKRKAESGVASQEGRVTKVKAEDLEAVSDGGLSEELEDVSEDEEFRVFQNIQISIMLHCHIRPAYN